MERDKSVAAFDLKMSEITTVVGSGPPGGDAPTVLLVLLSEGSSSEMKR